MKPTIFFLINSIDLIRGGLTRASLKQASFFAELGYETYMLTFNFNPRYPIIRQKLLEMNKIHQNVIIRNMYEELEGYEKPITCKTPTKKASLTELSEGLTMEKRPDHNAYRVFKNGLYIKYISLNNDGSLQFIDYFDENRYRTKRETYDPWGNLKKIAYMDLPLNKPRQLIYYDTNGKAFLTQWNNPNNGKVQRIWLFDKNSSIINSYVNDNVTYKVQWLHQTIDRLGGSQSVVISDTRSTDEILINLNHPKAAKVWRLHSNHLDKPFTVDADIAPKVKLGFNHIDCFDAAVFLTEEQKKDVIYRVGEKSHLKVVPHYHELSTGPFQSFISEKRKDEKLGVIISRLSTLKRVDHTVRAFKNVVERIPDAKLEIWGVGNQYSSLKKLINQLQLDNNVFLKGYTHYPDKIYQKALFSVLTSKSEGFALSVLESMYHKTPVISYNIKYGPRDMIENNINGFILENGSIDELSNKMIFMYENPKTAISMGKKAKKYIDKHFNREIYKEKWLDTVNLALHNKFKSSR